jgi:DNA ligase 1
VTRFAELAEASQRVAATRSRNEKKARFVEALRALPPDELPAAVGWLVAEPLCGPLGVGPAQLWALSRSEAPAEASVSLAELESALDEAKKGPRDGVMPRVAQVFGRLTQAERALFVGALTGSLRQGSLGGVMLLALADLTGQDEERVRRAAMVTGSLPRAAAALVQGAPPSHLTLFHPIAPMLAQPADSIDAAFAVPGEEALPLVVEWKVDGVRAQVHKQGDRVAIYSRQGNDITAGCTPLVAPLAAIDARAAVLDGEVVVLGPDGVARPFQDTFSTVASRQTAGAGDRQRILLFDCVHRDGLDLLDEPLARRREALAAIAPDELRMPSVLASGVETAKDFLRAALAAGHEGVMVKDPRAPYRSGARGGAWQKVKEFQTVDLVVLAAEWGHGRRKGLLSNLHLGARRDDGTFCMVGKTFKGLTDAMLAWQTDRLRALALDPSASGQVVHVRPELVVEIRYNDVQRSPRYPGGVALRFARVVRYREDKPAREADTLASLAARAPAPPPKRQLSLFGEG